ncbi:MAG: glycosyltransferase family 2 protein [Candidatus Omnitrophica bacterium]|nr:glycosyltransferase family 2 protein [Candidatus Omnitrophota bacterium]
MEAEAGNTIVVVPSYNEARTIGGIVCDTVKMGFNVLVIDDGSTDGTQREALDNGAMVIGHRQNRGKGMSIREGVRYVLEKMNYEWMIIMDGDGQHHPEDIPILVQASRHDGIDIIIGNRMMYPKTMPSVRYWTNRFTSLVVSHLCGQSVPDSQCGYRLVRVAALKKMELTSERYDIESEMLIEAARNNMKIVSVPIRTIYGSEVSEINPVKDTMRFFSLIRRHYFKKNGLRGTKTTDG